MCDRVPIGKPTPPRQDVEFPMVYLIGLTTLCATLCGGLFALRCRNKLHLILGFSAGAVIGVTFFDLLPEAVQLGTKQFSVSVITTTVAIGFIVYMLLDRLLFFHVHHDDHDARHEYTPKSQRGILGASSISVHSFLDGVAIGLAFQTSIDTGIIVAVAVLVHDFSDGINTVNLILKNGGATRCAVQWLILDATAPVLGVLSTLLFTLPETVLGLLLALFCGFFLYIGASDLLPESHHSHPKAWTTFMTIIGITTLYIAIKLLG
jgi:zinc transporter ZupT